MKQLKGMNYNTCDIMDKHQYHCTGRKNSGTKEYVQYDSIFMKC